VKRRLFQAALVLCNLLTQHLYYSTRPRFCQEFLA
jgi:hypothetical protein